MSSDHFLGFKFPIEVYYRPHSSGTKVYSDRGHLKGALKTSGSRGCRIYRAKVEWVDVTHEFFDKNWEPKK